MSNSYVMSPFIWTSHSMSCGEFLRNYRDKLPVVIRITEGYHGAAQMLSYSIDDMFWIYDVQKQWRIIARDEQNRYVSIPLETQFKFRQQVTKHLEDRYSCFSLGLGPPVSLASILEDPVRRLGSRFIFEHDREMPFVSELGVEGSTQFGTLEYVGCYRAYTLLGYNKHVLPSNSGDLLIIPNVNMIPDYVPIQFVVAVGVPNRDLSIFNSWIEFTKTKIKERRFLNTFKLLDCLLVFKEEPKQATEDKEYKSIQAKTVCHENRDFACKPPGDRSLSTSPGGRSLCSSPGDRSLCSSPGGRSLLPGEPSNERTYHSPDPRKRLSRVPHIYVNGSPGQRSRWSEVRSRQLDVRPEPTYVNFLPSGKTLDPNPTNEQQDLSEEIQQNAGMVLQTAKPASQDLDQTGIDWPNLKNLCDIPSDMIIEDLSVNQVAKCIELMNVSPEKVEKFRELNVDGSLLTNIVDETSLTAEFGLSTFEVKKLTLFFREKWRPRI